MMRYLIITCEHGGHEVPVEYQELFHGHEQLLNSHQGFDPGALELALDFSQFFQAPFHFSTTTRLLVELNRSLGNKSLFSSITKTLSAAEKKKIIHRYYTPYRREVEKHIDQILAEGFGVLHLSVHSFTPKLGSRVRQADVGLLYDPSRKEEKHLCAMWRRLLELDGTFRIRMNYPYQGKSDGFATYLRTLYAPDQYIGIELEVNQKFPLKFPEKWVEMKEDLVASLGVILKDGDEYA